MSNASPFWTSTLRDLSIDIKNATSHEVLAPQHALWSFGSPFGTPTLTNSQHGSSLGSVRVHSLTLFALPGACDMTPGSTYRPATLQPPCLGREPRLGLRQFLLLVSIQLEMFRLQMVRIIEHNNVLQVPSTCKLQAMAFQNSISMGFLLFSYFSNCVCVVVLSFISLNSISLICNIDDSITTTQFPVQILFLQGWALAFQFLVQVHLCVF